MVAQLSLMSRGIELADFSRTSAIEAIFNIGSWNRPNYLFSFNLSDVRAENWNFLVEKMGGSRDH